MQKNYILDANVLIHDPKSIFHFADNTVVIPIGVIIEIDRFKKERSDRGHNAREIVRRLDGLRRDQSLAAGVPLENGGSLRIHCEPDRVLKNGQEPADTEILRVAQAIQNNDTDIPVIIVTKDINLRIRADALGLTAEDYESDRVSRSELESTGTEITISADAMEAFIFEGEIPLPGDMSAPYPNTYVLLKAAHAEKSSALARINPAADRLIALREAPNGLLGIRPRNKEQYFAIDALLDDEIQLVTLMGRAGTGKTLLAIAAAMHRVFIEKSHRHTLICRPIFPVGRDLGYLPGDVQEKLDPWMKPVVDTVEFLIDTAGPIRGHKDCEALVSSGLMEIQPLTYIRGRNIANRFVVIDEAQNLTPLEVKTIITRIGANAKIVFTGDPDQIDNPYVDSMSNGFMYLINRFRDQPIAAHVELHKGERSPLAELAATLL
jgi:PhoH-like ATPase